MKNLKSKTQNRSCCWWCCEKKVTVRRLNLRIQRRKLDDAVLKSTQIEREMRVRNGGERRSGVGVEFMVF